MGDLGSLAQIHTLRVCFICAWSGGSYGMLAYIPVIIAFSVGMGIFAVMRRREIHPVLSGAAATFLSMIVIVAYFAFIVTTGRV